MRRHRSRRVKHVQAPAKVNTFVDAGIVPLVEALSLFPRLQTIWSCEGQPGHTSGGEEGEGKAFVTFSYGNSVKEAVAFSNWFANVFRGEHTIKVFTAADFIHSPQRERELEQSGLWSLVKIQCPRRSVKALARRIALLARFECHKP